MSMGTADPAPGSPSGAVSLSGVVLAVAASPSHGFSKTVLPEISLSIGLGVDGDAHAGVTVRHRSRVKVDPTQPNLRQVHLIHGELLDELVATGFHLAPGALGENITTRGLDILSLPCAARLHIGASVVLELTGLRNPCSQLDGYEKGLTAATLGRDAAGGLVRKAGVMAIVLAGGPVRPGDSITVVLPPEPHRRMEKV